MKKLKAFFYIFYNSLTSFEYYKDILNTSFSFSIKYLAMLALVATIITTAVLSTKEIPQVTKWIYEQKATFINLYPQDLEVKVENNKWNINQPQPYIIKTPEIFVQEDTSMPKNFVIFDQKGTINDFESRDTLILINETNLLVKTEGKFEVHPLKDLPNGILNKDSFIGAINQFDGIIKYVPGVFVVITAVFMFFYYFVFRLFYLIFVAVTLLIVNIVLKPDVEFKHLYRIGLHAMTVPFILDMALRISGIEITAAIPWFFILNVIIGILVMAKAAKINE